MMNQLIISNLNKGNESRSRHCKSIPSVKSRTSPLKWIRDPYPTHIDETVVVHKFLGNNLQIKPLSHVKISNNHVRNHGFKFLNQPTNES